MITAGANQAFVNVVVGLLDAQDRCVLFKPYYFNHLMVRPGELPAFDELWSFGQCSSRSLWYYSKGFQFLMACNPLRFLRCRPYTAATTSPAAPISMEMSHFCTLMSREACLLLTSSPELETGRLLPERLCVPHRTGSSKEALLLLRPDSSLAIVASHDV